VGELGECLKVEACDDGRETWGGCQQWFLVAQESASFLTRSGSTSSPEQITVLLFVTVHLLAIGRYHIDG
jgi:hypothetical protein